MSFGRCKASVFQLTAGISVSWGQEGVLSDSECVSKTMLLAASGNVSYCCTLLHQKAQEGALKTARFFQCACEINREPEC